MRRPGLWVANGTPTNPQLMLSWRPGAITSFFDYLTPNRVWQYKAEHPDAPVIIRFQHPRNWHEDPPASARRLADEVLSKWPELRTLDPYVYFANEMNLHYENGDPNPGNQPRYETREFYQKYADWVALVAARIKDRAPQMKLVTPPFAFGHHEDGAPDEDGEPTEGWAGYDFLADAVRTYFDDIITFHAYWGHAGGSVREWLYDPVLSSWYAFRWRRVLLLFRKRYHIEARVIIDEAGNFGAGDPDFTDQVIYYASETLKDARILALTYFLWEDPTLSPGNLLNSWWQRTINLADHLARLAAMPEVPIEPAGPTVRLLMDDGSVQVLPVEEYLRAVVPAEVYASWPMEALKVQAVAARSYTYYAIQHPRHPNADLCTDPAHCQAYDPDRIHPNTDRAIQLTAHEIIRYRGSDPAYYNAVANALYSANCGGHTLPNEVAFGTAGSAPDPVPYLRGVPCINPGPKQGHGVGLCQWGAHDMAQRGDGYETILKHYYTGVEVTSGILIETGAIRGTVYDQLGRPVADVRLRLSREGWSGAATTGGDGSYAFPALPAATYTLEAVDFDARREGLVLAPGQELVVDLVIQLPAEGWTMQIERGTGLPLLVGSMPSAGIQVSIQDPFGNVVQVVSGSKLEYGPGGWEVYAPYQGAYRIRFLDQVFDVPMNGQFTHVTLTEGGAPAQAGVIQGVLRDHQGAPQAGRQITLSGPGISRTAATGADGRYRFEGLPAGSYTLAVAGADVTHTVPSDGRTALTADLTLPPPPPGEWTMEITRGTGLPLLVGSLPEAGVVVNITDPLGNTSRVVSGSKPEFGAGGFETYAHHAGAYTLRFLDQTFQVPMNGQFTRVTFWRRAAPAPAEAGARLVSRPMSRSEVRAWLDRLDSDPQTRGLFSVEEL